MWCERGKIVENDAGDVDVFELATFPQARPILHEKIAAG